MKTKNKFYYVVIIEKFNDINKKEFLNYLNLNSKPIRLRNSQQSKEAIVYCESDLRILEDLHYYDKIEIIDKSEYDSLYSNSYFIKNFKKW